MYISLIINVCIFPIDYVYYFVHFTFLAFRSFWPPCQKTLCILIRLALHEWQMFSSFIYYLSLHMIFLYWILSLRCIYFYVLEFNNLLFHWTWIIRCGHDHGHAQLRFPLRRRADWISLSLPHLWFHNDIHSEGTAPPGRSQPMNGHGREATMAIPPSCRIPPTGNFCWETLHQPRKNLSRAAWLSEIPASLPSLHFLLPPLPHLRHGLNGLHTCCTSRSLHPFEMLPLINLLYISYHILMLHFIICE